MTSPTYDVSIPGRRWCDQDVVGEFAYKKALNELTIGISAEEREESYFTAELIPEPDNPFSTNGHAISVRWDNRVIGYLPETDSAQYQQIRRIIASGYTPTATARLWFYTSFEGDKSYYVRLSLRRPEQLAPLNDPPQEGWTLLPGGGTSQVTKESDHLDVLLDYVPPAGVGQLLVTLHLVQAGVKTKYQAVEVRLDGQRIGELTKQTSAKYAAAVEHFNAIGLTVVSRATIKGSSLSAEVTLQSAKAHELSDDDLEPEISPLPRLVPYSADASEYSVPDAYTGKPRSSQNKKQELSWEEQYDDSEEVVEDASWEDIETESVRVEGEPRSRVSSEMPSTPKPPINHYRTDQRSSGTSFIDAAKKVPNKGNILLWVGTVFAGMCVLTGLAYVGDSLLVTVGYIFIGAGVALACGWPLRCRSLDKKRLAAWEQQRESNRALDRLLTDEDRALLNGMEAGPAPSTTPRQWKVVAPIAMGLIIVGFVVFGVGAQDLPEVSTTTTS
jgi:hypothetical protein